MVRGAGQRLTCPESSGDLPTGLWPRANGSEPHPAQEEPSLPHPALLGAPDPPRDSAWSSVVWGLEETFARVWEETGPETSSLLTSVVWAMANALFTTKCLSRDKPYR